MRTLATFYTISVSLTLCWISSTFGFPRLVLAFLLALPGGFVLWRLALRNRSISWYERAYLAVVGMMTVGAIGFLIFQSYELRLDRHAKFEREYHAFRQQVANMSEYGAVEVSYTHRKGGRVYLKGTVATKDSYDRLIALFESSVQSNESGYYDGVVYPDKPVPSPK